MNILVLNCGSSSIKYQLFDMGDREQRLIKGLADRIGLEDSCISSEHTEGRTTSRSVAMPDHRAALQAVFADLKDQMPANASKASELHGIGHRVVHGGAHFSGSVRVDEGAMRAIGDAVKLAPLHNLASLMGIEACQSHLPGVPNVAVFDTALHQTMPAKAYLYGLPVELCETRGIRRYGFHGISHGYVAHEAARLLHRPIESLKIITCHLGSGCSITAFDHGRSVDTSMGFTPLEGVVMGTRSGDLDPAVVLSLIRDVGLSVAEADTLLNHRSGLQGLCGTSDMRDILARAERGDARAAAAVQVFVYRIQKYIGAFTATLAGVDVILFTAGIGENSAYLREQILEPFEYLGLRIDKRLNARHAPIFSTRDSAVYAMTVRTDEELVIARETYRLINASGAELRQDRFGSRR